MEQIKDSDFQRQIEEQRLQFLQALPHFRNQTDWTDENVQRIRYAITNGIIKTNYELRSLIGNQSKKYGSNNSLTYAAQIAENKYAGSDAKLRANENEHIFYSENAPILKSIGSTKRNGRFYLNDTTTKEQEEALEHSKKSFFQREIYDYMMGKILYTSFRDIATDIDNYVSDDELLKQVNKLITLRHKENELFKLLGEIQNLPEGDEGHIKAEEKEKNTLAQLLTYFRWKDRFQVLIDNASHYKKYLKYKQKYIALKNRL